MYVRVVTGQVQPGKGDDLAAQWQAFFATRLQQAPGFRHAYFTLDRATDTVVTVSVWDTAPDQARMQAGIDEFMTQVRDLIVASPQTAVYEVLAEV